MGGISIVFLASEWRVGALAHDLRMGLRKRGVASIHLICGRFDAILNCIVRVITLSERFRARISASRADPAARATRCISTCLIAVSRPASGLRLSSPISRLALVGQEARKQPLASRSIALWDLIHI